MSHCTSPLFFFLLDPSTFLKTCSVLVLIFLDNTFMNKQTCIMGKKKRNLPLKSSICFYSWTCLTKNCQKQMCTWSLMKLH